MPREIDVQAVTQNVERCRELVQRYRTARAPPSKSSEQTALFEYYEEKVKDDSIKELVATIRTFEKLVPDVVNCSEFSNLRKAMKKIEKLGFYDISLRPEAVMTIIANSEIYLSAIKRFLDQHTEPIETIPQPLLQVEPTYVPEQPAQKYQSPQRPYNERELPFVSQDELLNIPLIPQSAPKLLTTAVDNTVEGGRVADVKPWIEKAEEILRNAGDVDSRLLDVYKEVLTMFDNPQLGIRDQVIKDQTLTNKVIDVSVMTKMWLTKKGIDVTLLNETLQRYSESTRRPI